MLPTIHCTSWKPNLGILKTLVNLHHFFSLSFAHDAANTTRQVHQQKTLIPNTNFKPFHGVKCKGRDLLYDHAENNVLQDTTFPKPKQVAQIAMTEEQTKEIPFWNVLDVCKRIIFIRHKFNNYFSGVDLRTVLNRWTLHRNNKIGLLHWSSTRKLSSRRLTDQGPCPCSSCWNRACFPLGLSCRMGVG